MRMHKRAHLEERVASLKDTVLFDADTLKITSAVCLEIGCGKGGFICKMARKNPDRDFVAAELVDNVLILAAEKAQAAKIPNLRFVSGDIMKTEGALPDHCCEVIYLNFSDPWPKKRHTKRRLTYKSFLAVYKRLLAPGGELHMKTDNRELFLYSLESLSQNGFAVKNITWDLHNSRFAADNVMTEYEEKFHAQGAPIYRLEAFVL